MHPKMIMAVAREIETERRRDGREVQLRSPALADHTEGRVGSQAALGLARGLLAGINLRPRLS